LHHSKGLFDTDISIIGWDGKTQRRRESPLGCIRRGQEAQSSLGGEKLIFVLGDENSWLVGKGLLWSPGECQKEISQSSHIWTVGRMKDVRWFLFILKLM
jgi:hypothetical protein